MSVRITEGTIEIARTEFMRRLYVWEDREDKVDGVDVSCAIRVEIARGVTPEMLEKMPYKWLVGLTVELSADGVLELVDVEGRERCDAKGAAFMALDSYADEHFQPANRLKPHQEYPDVYSGQKAKPDCVLSANFDPEDQPLGQRRRLPLVVVEIEVHHSRTVPESIQQARLYLSEPHVLRAVVFKFFESRAATDATGCLYKAALAVVFERVGDAQAGELAEIRVVQEVSFGTAPLHESVLVSLCEVPSRTCAAGVVRVIAPSPLQWYTIQANNVDASFPLPQHDLAMDLAPRFASPLIFKLNKIFECAASGWEEDRSLQPDTAPQ